MKISELREYFSESVIEEKHINPLEIAESQEFGKRDRPGDLDYRDRAIARVTHLGLSFSSTMNSVVNLAQRYIKVSCPYCGNDDTECRHGGGNFHAMTVSYTCKSCKAVISLTLAEGGISAKK